MSEHLGSVLNGVSEGVSGGSETNLSHRREFQVT